jgi:hypothetical protein
MYGFQIYHLNLAFSSIPAEARPEVIERCYWPLLRLAEQRGIPVGIELTGWTLQQIQQLAPEWMTHFREMLERGGCELIGSGWSQMIGPLAPVAVNRWNQKLGLEAYSSILGRRPRLALVNEMAFSSSLVNIYLESGYEGIIMDRDNVRMALGLDYKPLSAVPTHALGHGNAALPVLWSDSNLFQRLQRAVHGDIPLNDYFAYVSRRKATDGCVLPIYCNDAEVFDYRPGRFTNETRLHPEGEWKRLDRLCAGLVEEACIQWVSPTAALAANLQMRPEQKSQMSSSRQPVPVKKQAKYNINRWSLTGRDNLWLNACCHRRHQTLLRNDEQSAEPWRELCELWASDLRTHITESRWKDVLLKVAHLNPSSALPHVSDASDVRCESLPPSVECHLDEEGIFQTITTAGCRLTLNLRRGLAIQSLAFRSHEFVPVIGTLEQGFFETIELGADFYSGGVLIEIPGERRRLTDLEWTTPELKSADNKLIVTGSLPMGSGKLVKRIEIDLTAENLALSYEFHGMERPLGIVRVGILTLLPSAWQEPLEVVTWLGGSEPERFHCEDGVWHGAPVSMLISSSSALGGTEGHLELIDARGQGLGLRWNPSECPVAPMLKHLATPSGHLTRLSFSLCELDDTSRAGGHLLPLRLEVAPL